MSVLFVYEKLCWFLFIMFLLQIEAQFLFETVPHFNFFCKKIYMHTYIYNEPRPVGPTWGPEQVPMPLMQD